MVGMTKRSTKDLLVEKNMIESELRKRKGALSRSEPKKLNGKVPRTSAKTPGQLIGLP